ncbi:ABC transporter substrate-binding protein [Alloscardovia criceti]|uniref:ABC transporter substrate-binding protein n=1 Tax=Alloscardovia criceti TaxID=356828 RepID=UPI00036A5D13|nr:extracellular solute-binding protein [Alloscardovia criceti]
MKIGQKALAVLGSVAMLGSLAACGSSSGSANSTSSDGKTTLTVWAWDSTVARTVAGFEKENPDITVNVVNAGTSKDEYTGLSNAMQAGSGAPDIAQIEYYALPEYVIRGYVQDLSDLGAKDYSDFYTPGTWSSVNISGGVYGLPMDSGPMAWFYNKEVFDKAGVDPTQVTTWDQFYEAAKKIRETGSYITSDSGDAGFFDSMTWQNGAKPFTTSADGKSVSIKLTSDEKVQEFEDFWQKLIDEDLIDTKTAGWTDDWNKGLNNGSIASLLIGAWMPYNLLSGAPDGDGKWRVTQMPTSDGSAVNSESGGSSFAIIKSDDSAKVAAAYKYIEYACHNKDGIATRVEGGAFPADNDTLASESFLNQTSLTDADGNAHEYFGGQKFNEELAKAAKNVRSGYTFLPFEVYARGKFGDFVGASYTGNQKLSDGVKAWQDDLISYAKQQGYTVNE